MTPSVAVSAPTLPIGGSEPRVLQMDVEPQKCLTCCTEFEAARWHPADGAGQSVDSMQSAKLSCGRGGWWPEGMTHPSPDGAS